MSDEEYEREHAAKEKAFQRIVDLPPGKVFRWNSDDFSEFTKDSYQLDISGTSETFQKFMHWLTAEVINPEWTLQAILVKEERKSTLSLLTYLERTLDLFFVNEQMSGLSIYGDYHHHLIREGVEKPFSNNWATNFGQNELARGLDYLFTGTDTIPLDVHDWPHSVYLPLQRSAGDFFRKRRPTLEVYQEGVRRLNMKLVPIDIAIYIVKRDMSRPELEAAGIARLEELEGYTRGQEPFLSYNDFKPLPEQFKAGLEQKYERIWTPIEEAFRRIGEALRRHNRS